MKLHSTNDGINFEDFTSNNSPQKLGILLDPIHSEYGDSINVTWNMNRCSNSLTIVSSTDDSLEWPLIEEIASVGRAKFNWIFLCYSITDENNRAGLFLLSRGAQRQTVIGTVYPAGRLLRGKSAEITLGGNSRSSKVSQYQLVKIRFQPKIIKLSSFNSFVFWKFENLLILISSP